MEETEVAEGCVYVLGDNRPNTVDSRRFGCVPLGDVVGVAQYVFWAGPEGRFGALAAGH